MLPFEDGETHIAKSSSLTLDALDIEQQVNGQYLIPNEHNRKKKYLARMRNQKGYRYLQLSTSKLAFQLVSLAKTKELPNGSLAKA